MQLDEAFKLTCLLDTEKEEAKLKKLNDELSKILSLKKDQVSKSEAINNAIYQIYQEKMKISNDLFYKLEGKNQKISNFISLIKKTLFNMRNHEYNSNCTSNFNLNYDEMLNKSKELNVLSNLLIIF
jgi:hypothetical protein